MAAFRDAAPARDQPGDHRQRRGHDQRCDDQQGPPSRRRRWDDPGGGKGGERQRRLERPAEVVDHLPSADSADRAPGAVVAVAAPPSGDPGQELPVTAGPAMVTRGILQVVRRELVEQFDVGRQTGPCEDTFEQVVAQHRVLRHSIVQRRCERIDVVDPLAGEAALLEQVLVDVRHRGGVRVDSGRAGEHLLEDRRVLALGQCRGDPWLQESVTVRHTAESSVEARSVERMRNRADESSDHSARQARVGIERHDVAHSRRRQ